VARAAADNRSNRLVQGLVKLGLPLSLGCTVGLAIRYLPTAYGLYVSIGEAAAGASWIVGQGGLCSGALLYPDPGGDDHCLAAAE